MPIPKIVGIVYVSTLFSIVFGTLGFVFWRSRKKAPIEKGLVPIHSERCGGKLKRLLYSGPFFRVALYETFLVISSRELLVINYQDIQNIFFKKRPFYRWNGITFLERGKSRTIYLTSQFPDRLKKILDENLAGVKKM